MHYLCSENLHPMNKAQAQTQVIRFKRYSRKAYAAFCSMHKHITIGKLATALCDKQLTKSKLAHTSSADCLAFYTPVFSDESFVDNEMFAFDVLPLGCVAVIPTTYSTTEGQEASISCSDCLYTLLLYLMVFSTAFLFAHSFYSLNPF